MDNRKFNRCLLLAYYVVILFIGIVLVYNTCDIVTLFDEGMVSKKKSPSQTEQSGLDIVAEFMSRYRKEFDFYEQACRTAAQLLDANLQSAGVRAIVTSRAKSPSRLEAKVRQRASTKNFQNVDQIYEDIVDLAGIRVALYFPAEREAAGKIILSLFSIVETPKEFPDKAKLLPASYTKRFSGYWASHYRVRIRDEQLNESQKRYLEAKFEIQVASVLMHAWSEVEHDLVYKPLQGMLSEEEYSILDELNGMVLAGEIALERLQRAGEARISNNHFYTNHYDLATSLLEFARKQSEKPDLHETLIGRVDLLFKLLRQIERNTPEQVRFYLTGLHNDFERRPIAEQVIDQVLLEDPQRYAIYNSIRAEDGHAKYSEMGEAAINEAVERFLSKYVQFENHLRKYIHISRNDPVMSTASYLSSMHENGHVVQLPPTFVEAANRIRRFRNSIVHGVATSEIHMVDEYERELQMLIDQLKEAEKSMPQ